MNTQPSSRRAATPPIPRTRASSSASATWAWPPSAAAPLRVAATLDATGDSPVLEGTIDAAGLTTYDEQRDGHLASPDFFDSARFPTISFHSSEFDPQADGSFRLAGELTMKGVTKPIDLQATVTGSGQDPWGNERVGLDISGILRRSEYGVSWNAPLPGGGLLLDDRVQLEASFSFVKQG